MGLLSWLFPSRPQRCGRLIGDGKYEFEVVGEASYQRALEAIAGGRTEEGSKVYCAALLLPEPSNRHDPKAVAIIIRRYRVAYLSRENAPRFLTALARAGCDRAATEALICGGWARPQTRDYGHFGVKLNAVLPFRIEPPVLDF